MATESTEPERDASPEAPALHNFVEQYLLPKTLALIRAGRDMDFFDQLNEGGIPELIPPLVQQLSLSDDPEARTTAGYHAEQAAIAGGGVEFYSDVMSRLVKDQDAEVADLAQFYLHSTGSSASKHPDIAEAARQLDDQLRRQQTGEAEPAGQ